MLRAQPCGILAFAAASGFSFLKNHSDYVISRIPRAASWVHLIDLNRILLTNKFYSKAARDCTALAGL